MCFIAKRKLDEAETSQLPPTGLPTGTRGNTSRSIAKFSSAFRLSTFSISKATPSHTPGHIPLLPSAPLVNKSLLSSTTPDINTICIGGFGSCTEMIYQDVFMVCVKKMEKDKVSLQGVKSEAAILGALNTGGFTPHCFGVCLSLHAVVMSYVSVSSRPVTMFSLLYSKDFALPLTSEHCTNILINLCKGVQYIHYMTFLHNDLKLDNVVIGDTL